MINVLFYVYIIVFLKVGGFKWLKKIWKSLPINQSLR